MSYLNPLISVNGREASGVPLAGDVARLRRYLERVIARMCPRWMAGEREDLLQGALIRVMTLANGRHTGPISAAYARRVAYTQVVDEIRRRGHHRESSLERLLEESDFEVSSPIADPERDTSSRELGLAIQDCVRRLIPSRRRAITLSLMGRKNREIASLMGWNPKRTENLVTRGRAQLRQCLESKGQGI